MLQRYCLAIYRTVYNCIFWLELVILILVMQGFDMVSAAMFEVCLQCIDDDFLCTCSIVPVLIFELVYSFIHSFIHSC